MILIVEQIFNTILALRLFCNWIKTVSNWDQWPKLEKSASHSGKKSTVNKSAQCEQTDIYLLYEINRCEHCYVTACIFIYNSFQITAKMLNANLMNRQQTSIMLQTKWNYVCMSYHAHSLYNSTHKKGKQSLRIISLSTQSCLFFVCLPFDATLFSVKSFRHEQIAFWSWIILDFICHWFYMENPLNLLTISALAKNTIITLPFNIRQRWAQCWMLHDFFPQKNIFGSLPICFWFTTCSYNSHLCP